MTTAVTFYRAIDGKVFDSEAACLKYEREERCKAAIRPAIVRDLEQWEKIRRPIDDLISYVTAIVLASEEPLREFLREELTTPAQKPQAPETNKVIHPL